LVSEDYVNINSYFEKRSLEMAKKTVSYNKSGVEKLPDNKPVVYRIQTIGDKTNYVGVAKKGRVQERISEHLEDGKIPGAKVQIEQMPSIDAAKEKEENIISRTEPKYNE
jgi:CRISPR/Cas system-associated protein Cas5 (RAMP superfamily)